MSYENEFDEWNDIKKKTHLFGKRPYFVVGEIWWAQIGKNISTELIGKGVDYLRPVIVLQRVYGNACIVVPLTSHRRDGDYYFNFEDSVGIQQCAILPQIKYIDGKRLKYKKARVCKKDLCSLKDELITLIKK